MIVNVVLQVVIVQEIFQSYLKLLVNTRNELALAHIFNTPHRALTHESFTHLKYEAQERKISLYQERYFMHMSYVDFLYFIFVV